MGLQAPPCLNHERPLCTVSRLHKKTQLIPRKKNTFPTHPELRALTLVPPDIQTVPSQTHLPPSILCFCHEFDSRPDIPPHTLGSTYLPGLEQGGRWRGTVRPREEKLWSAAQPRAPRQALCQPLHKLERPCLPSLPATTPPRR